LEAGKSGETQRLNVAPNGDSYELVYANLDFTNVDPSAVKPQLFAAQSQQPLNLHLPVQQPSINLQTLSQTVVPQVLLHQSALVGAQQVLPVAGAAAAHPINPLQVPPKKQPPATRPKPQIRPQHMRTTQSNGIEYAKLAFATKADL
jgi:hypothetical protein